MASNPKVTVLMSVYNGEKYLRQAIDSILAQTHSDFEFVIYDDCSTDSSAEIIASYRDKRIVFRRNKTNQGLTKNLAEGVALARGEYIARMDADDISMPERLERQVAWMDAHPEVTILGSRVMYFTKDGNSGVTNDPLDDETIKAILLVSFTMLHPTIMIRKADLVDKGVNYDSSFRYSQDHALYFECILRHLKFANHPEPLLRMRSHGESISKAKHAVQQECSCRARNKVLESMGVLADIDQDELTTYNSFASGEFPSTVEGIAHLASFAERLLCSRDICEYFNVDILRRVFANKVWGMAYASATQPIFSDAISAMKAFQDIGLKRCWTMKQHFKFFLKRIYVTFR